MKRKPRPRKRHRFLGVLVFSIGTAAAALTALLAVAVVQYVRTRRASQSIELVQLILFWCVTQSDSD